MPITCNIDARGKLVRLCGGIALVIAGGILLFAWAVPRGTIVAWAVSIACILGGAFAIFESRKSWCVLRAMGMKTPV